MKKILSLFVLSLFLLSFAFAAEAQIVDKQLRVVAVPTLYGAQANGSDDMFNDSLGVEKQPRAIAVPTLYGEKGNGSGDMIGEQKQLRNGSGPLIDRNGSMVHAGLAKALDNVKNENAREALQRNMNRFIEKHKSRFDAMADVEVEADEETGELNIKAKEQVKYFGFIKGKAIKNFEIKNNGQITEKQPWYSFVYKNMNTESTE